MHESVIKYFPYMPQNAIVVCSRMSRIAIATLCGLLFAPASCRSTQSRIEPAQVVCQIIAADNARNVDDAMAHYTKDVVWIPPRGELVIGSEAVRERYRAMYRTYKIDLAVEVEEVETASGLAVVRGITRGTLTSRRDDTETVVHDRFLAILRRADGRWRVAQLMWVAAD